jgi:thymidylate kinase
VSDGTKGVWICIDGVEGTGKTTVAEGLTAALPVEMAPEFSSAPFGIALRDAVRTSPHYISVSALGQSLVFLGDFIEIYASTVAPRVKTGAAVVTDRGYVSKYTYQEIVLRDSVGAGRTRRLLDEIFAQLPPPELTIYLTAPMEVLRARLVRRDGSCDQTRIEFIARAADAMAAYLHRHRNLSSTTIDADRPVAAVLHDAMLAVRLVLPYSS